ncbi:MAG TPA: twin-arginine translocase subunit TatC, partial [Thermomonas sp.]|nr:twin-arginine translocase subunit TatC [Thermomonas sp.]
MADAGDDLERPLIAHLLELRSRLLRGFAGLVVVLVCLLPFSNKLYALLAQPLLDKLPKGGQLIATQVASPFFAPMKLA